MRTALAALLLLLASSACAPERAAPVKVVALTFNEQTRTYQPSVVQLTTVTDVVGLQGSAANIKGGAKLVIDPSDPAQNPPYDATRLKAAVLRDEGSPVKVNYVERDGILTPADFHSLNLVTTYFNVEQALGFFGRIGGLEAKDLGTPDVFYFADLEAGKDRLEDNAYFYPLVQGFLVLPFESLQQVPLSINLGIIGHEYSHAVLNYKVFDKDPLPGLSWSVDFLPSPGLNLLKAIDEGIADTFGTGVTCSEDLATCNPEFISLSLPAPHPENRRLDKAHCMSPGLHDSIASQTFDSFHAAGLEYEVGSVLSSALWRAATDANVVQRLGAGEARKQMFQALYKSLGGGSSPGLRELIKAAQTDQTLFTLETTSRSEGVLDAIASNTNDPALKAAMCSAFLDRFGFSLDNLKACPATARSFNECPR